ncbi:MAG: hypothetical protein LUO80_12450 [Methylococcaceae bacterium]|nr:hypothetical protein [Methylococcaceae bacterium]
MQNPLLVPMALFPVFVQERLVDDEGIAGRGAFRGSIDPVFRATGGSLIVANSN